MRIFSTLLLALVVFALAAFAAANWQMVTVRILPGTDLVVRLPVLLFAVALLGAVPASVAHSIGRWTWRRRLTRTERELETAKIGAGPICDMTVGLATPLPPQAQPLVVPPAGA